MRGRIAERFESREDHYDWRARIRELLVTFDEEPVYLEALLASRWFPSDRAKHITSLAEVKGRGGRPFVEVLLDSVENSEGESAVRGTRFEGAVGLLLSSTPGFEVDSARKTTDEQTDLVVCYAPEPESGPQSQDHFLPWISYGSAGLFGFGFDGGKPSSKLWECGNLARLARFPRSCGKRGKPAF
jgi:hypothetical protein